MGNLGKTCLKFLPGLAFAAAAMAPLRAAAETAETPKIEFDEFNVRMALEFGQLVKGSFQTAGDKASKLDFQPLNRNIIFLTQNGRFGEAWEVSAGLMGVLWWPFTAEAGPPATRTVRVDPRLSILRGRYGFGEADNRSFVEFGYFPYKYNRDAWNLGEYLYRSGTYPGNVVTTDGYQLMDHAAYDAYGAHFRYSTFAGKVLHDVNLFSEPNVDPIGDITPAYELSLNLGALQMGVGAAYNRGLSYRPSLTRRDDPANEYIEVAADPGTGRAYYKGPLQGAPDAVQSDTTKPYTMLSRWTQQGVKLMTRAAVDLGSLLPEDLRSPDDLRLYAEVAVLGWKNQPYYYEKRSQRIPIMAGLNLPTFKMIDLLAFQVEYYDNPFNDMYNYNILSLPVWKVQDYQTMDKDTYVDSPWKWSLHARKSLNRILDIHIQAASDHLRLRDLLSAPTEYEMTLKPANWYYLVRMEMGI